MPGGEVFRIRQASKESLDVIVCLGVTRDGVVDVISRLLPRIEDDFFPGVIRVQRGDDPFDGIVEQDRADPYADVELEFGGYRLKKGSYCLIGLPLLLKIVQPLPTQRGLTMGPPSTTEPGSACIFF